MRQAEIVEIGEDTFREFYLVNGAFLAKVFRAVVIFLEEQF